MDDEKLLTYYWNYFELHSNQRMQMINFYITVEVVLIGALFALLGMGERLVWAEHVVSIAITGCSAVFFFLDKRTQFLIKESELCIKAIENRLASTYDRQFKLLNNIDDHTKGTVFRNTYTRIFVIVYGVVALFGIYTYFGL